MEWTNRDIIKYYLENEFAYSLWGKNMHYGYWEKGVRTQQRASLRFNEVVAQKVGITADDVVLDAGCGVGGCSIYLAQTFGCRTVGLTITPRQVDLARRNARRAGVGHLCEFHEMDYMHPEFPDASFSVVWGLESVCYASSTEKFIAEAFRLLRPGGRLVVADGFASYESYTGRDSWLMQRWLDGWIVNFLNTPGQFRDFARKAGFAETDYRDVTRFVKPTSLIMLFVSLPFLPLHIIDRIVRIRQYPTDACFNQYFALKKGLWQYGIFYAKKPE